MKKYIIKLSAFVLILVSVLYFGSRIYQYCLELAVKEIDLIPIGVKILAFGDSHIEHSINDNIYPVFQNRASSGEGYYYNYVKLRNMLSDKRNNIDEIQCIILTFNNFSFNRVNRDSIFVGDKVKQYVRNYKSIHQNRSNNPSNFGMPIDAEYSKEELLAKINLIDSKFLKALISSGDSFFKNAINTDKYKGGFIDENSNFEDNGTQRALIQFRNVENFEANFSNSIQLDILKKISELTYSNNIPLVLVNTPCHESFYIHLYDKLESYNNTIAEELNKRYGVIYLDYLRYPMADSCFRDSDHLNRTGANIFTPMLLDTLTRLGLYIE